MDLLQPDPPEWSATRLRLERDRVCDRLRSMSLSRLGAPLADQRSRSDAALATAQRLVDLRAQALDEPGRRLPRLPPHAVGDAVAVVTNDLLADVLGMPDSRPDRPPGQVCAHAVRELVALRALL